jgi:hypothetical protein
MSPTLVAHAELDPLPEAFSARIAQGVAGSDFGPPLPATAREVMSMFFSVASVGARRFGSDAGVPQW